MDLRITGEGKSPISPGQASEKLNTLATGSYNGLKVAVKTDIPTPKGLDGIDDNVTETEEKEICDREPVEEEQKVQVQIKELGDLFDSNRFRKFMALLMRMANAGQKPEAKELQGLLSHHFTDISEMHAALVEAGGRLKASPESRMVTDALQTEQLRMERENGPGIQAGYNIQEAVHNASLSGLAHTDDLRTSYRGVIHGAENLRDAYAQIDTQFADRSFEDAIEFLIQASGHDLNSQGPSMALPALKQSVDGLIQIQMLGGLHSECDDLLSRMAREFKESPSLSGRQLMASVVALTGERFVGEARTTALCEQTGIRGIEGRVHFFQDLKGIVRQMPLKAFDTGETRNALINSLQDALDTAIDIEEEHL